jgi:hypothetical protein
MVEAKKNTAKPYITSTPYQIDIQTYVQPIYMSDFSEFDMKKYLNTDVMTVKIILTFY